MNIYVFTGWRDITRAPDITDPPLDKAKAIVKRYYEHGYDFPLQVKQKYKAKIKRPLHDISQPQEESQGGNLSLPQDEDIFTVMHQAQRDHDRLRYWLSQESAGDPTDGTIQALQYCDLNMPGRFRCIS